MKNKVKNYILVRYEDLRDDYENTLDLIANKFMLRKKYDNYVHIDYRVRFDVPFVIDENEVLDRNEINKYLDMETENRLNQFALTRSPRYAMLA